MNTYCECVTEVSSINAKSTALNSYCLWWKYEFFCSGIFFYLHPVLNGTKLQNWFTNDCHFVLQHLVSVVADGIYIHNLRDMKLLHVIPAVLPDVPSVCVLSPGMPVLGQDTPSYLAYSDSTEMKIFDIADLVQSDTLKSICSLKKWKENIIDWNVVYISNW